MARANAEIHGMLAYGYYIADNGQPYVRYKTSWGGSGDNTISAWSSAPWQAGLPVRGVIGYHPLPRITQITRTSDSVTIDWQGPSSVLSNLVDHTATRLNWYVVEQANRLGSTNFTAVSEPTSDHQVTMTNCCDPEAFFRVKMVGPPSGTQIP
jgi:hypothetical protein